MHSSIRSHRLRLVIPLLALVVGCASGGGAPSAPSLTADGSKVGSIEVIASREMPSGDHAEQFEKYSVASRLQQELRTRLQSSGQYAAGGALSLRVAVSDFRLRTGAGAFWGGAMAGSDYLNVEVDVLRDGASVRQFPTNASTTGGGAFNTSPTGRSERLIATVAERVRRGI